MSGDNDPNDTDQGEQGDQGEEPPQGGQGGQPPQGGQGDQPPQGGQGGQPPQGGQGGQPPQGGQGSQPPQGGQGGQPPQGGQGGQPPQGGQGGQPAQGGQPVQGGQPSQPVQGGQAYGQQRGPGGASITDKLQRPEVKESIIETVAVYGVLGLGVLIALFIVPGLGDGAGALASRSVGVGIMSIGFGAGFLFPVLFAQDTADSLDVEQNVKLASTFIANAGGYFVLGLLTSFGAAASAEDLGLVTVQTSGSGLNTQTSTVEAGLGDFFLPVIFVAVLVGLLAVGAVFADDYLSNR